MNDTDYWGPDRLAVAEDVAATLGAETIERIRADPQWRTSDCWRCGDDADGRDQPIGVVVTVHRGGALTAARIAHTRCAPSAIYIEDDEPVPADAAAPSGDGHTDLQALALMWPPGGENVAPLLLVDFGVQVTYKADNGDLVDALTQFWLESGWELVARLGTLPTTAPAGTGCVWQVRRDRVEAGHLLIGGLGPSGHPQPLVEVDLETPDLWTGAVLHTRRLSVLVGPFGIDDTWADGVQYTAIQRAVKAGHVVGATLPIDTRGPDGNPMPPYEP